MTNPINNSTFKNMETLYNLQRNEKYYTKWIEREKDSFYQDEIDWFKNSISTEGINFDYNFMEGKDPNNQKEYDEQTLLLGQGQLAELDTNQDGEISFDEYVYDQNAYMLEDPELYTKEDVLEAHTNSALLFSIIDNGMGNSDSSGTLSAEEFASFYKNLDQFAVDENSQGYLTGEFDGVVNVKNTDNMISFLIDNLVPQSLQDQEKNLLDQILTLKNMEKQQVSQLYKNMINWQQQHTDAINNALEASYLAETDAQKDEIAQQYNDEATKIGYEFDFMEGKDPNNKEEYNEQTLKLGQGDVISMDTNGDGEVSYEEYLNYELNGLTEEEYEIARPIAGELFHIIDENLENSDFSGTLSAKEFASFYKNLDQLEVDENFQGQSTGMFDGKLNINSMDISAFIEQFAN